MNDLFIGPDGTVRTIYADDAKPLLAAVGALNITRASHVEPTTCGEWYVDMRPVGGPILATYATRAEALAAEVAWLTAHNVPVPR